MSGSSIGSVPVTSKLSVTVSRKVGMGSPALRMTPSPTTSPVNENRPWLSVLANVLTIWGGTTP